MALISGCALAAAYRPLGWHFLAWVALVPWLLVLPRMGAGTAFLGGMLLGLVFYRIGLAWVFSLNGPLAGIAVVVLSIWMGLGFRVASLLMDRFGAAAMLWAVPLAFVGQEVVRSEGLPRLRFAFLALGYSQSAGSPVAQIASLGGVYFISLLIVLVNCALAWLVFRKTSRAAAIAGAAVCSVVIFALLGRPDASTGGRSVAVACVQAETDRDATYAELTQQALAHPLRPKFVVLPEHTITSMANEKNFLIRALAPLAREYKAYICVGGHVPAERGAACSYDNVGLLIGPDGRIVGSQAKAVPVPFFDDGNPARSQTTFDTPFGRAGICVCYDALFTDFPRRAAGLGAELLLVPVMDPAPWPSQERWQHADMAPYRSIELRRAAVRAASSGISQIVDPRGRVLAVRTQTDGPGIISAKIPIETGRTVFAGGGYLLAPAIGCAYLALIVLLTLADWTNRLRRPTDCTAMPRP